MSQVFLPELVIENRRLGRQVNHDPRSLRFLLHENTVPQDASWDRHIPILDQGNLGSCTGNALTGALGSGPLYDALSVQVRGQLTEKFAVDVYSQAERIDGGEGYPPEDEGSSGLSVAKVAAANKWISGYQHATSVAAAHTAIQAGPFIIGTYWYSDMDEPAKNGVVSPTGTIRGGHEYLCRRYELASDLWWFDNSWSDGWGVDGSFCYSSNALATLLSGQGDITSLVPVSQPKPTPVASVTRTFDAAVAANLDNWSNCRHTGANKQAADDWKSGR